MAAQLGAVSVCVLYTVVVTYGLLRVVEAVVGLRVVADIEREGLDVNLHGEQGYVFGTALGHPAVELVASAAPGPVPDGTPRVT